MLVTENNFVRAMEDLDREETELFTDTEATGLTPWAGDRLCGISAKRPGPQAEAYYFPFRHKEGPNLEMRKLKFFGPLMSKPKVTYVGWNYPFDMQTMMQDGVPLPVKIEEVSAAAHLMNENEEHFKLKKIAKKYVAPESDDEEEKLAATLLKNGWGKGDMWKLPSWIVEPYACDDVRLTERVRDFYLPHLRNWKLYDLWRELNEYALMICEMECLGMPLDVPLIEQYVAESRVKQVESLAVIRTLTGNPAANPNSHPQMQKWLGLKSTARDVLEDLEHIPGVVELLEHRGWHRVEKNYYKVFLELMDQFNRLHPNFNMIGTETGRLSAAKPPIQAVPGPNSQAGALYPHIYKIKDVFPVDDGYEMFEADYSLAEVRVGAHYAKAKALIDKLNRGVDIHGETAKEAGMPRPAAKRLNFSAQYGIGKDTLAGRLKIPRKEAEEYLRKYHALNPEIRSLYNRAQMMADQRGYIRMFTGRMRHYNVAFAPTHKASSNLIQGSVAEMIRIAIMRLRKELRIDLHLQVHDSVVGRIKVGTANKILPEVKRIMEDTPWLSVVNKVDIKKGSRWGNLEKWTQEAT